MFIPNSFSTSQFGDGSGGSSGGGFPPTPPPQEPDRSPEIRMVLFGPEPAIRLTISNLHHRGYAEPNDWCKPQPTGKPGEVVTVLIRRVPLN